MINDLFFFWLFGCAVHLFLFHRAMCSGDQFRFCCSLNDGNACLLRVVMKMNTFYPLHKRVRTRVMK